ncbi:MAG: hypothetical protein ACJ8AG_12045, partial [Ktedonobacteraceae bacterium]
MLRTFKYIQLLHVGMTGHPRGAYAVSVLLQYTARPKGRVWHRVDRERGALQPFSPSPPPNRTGEFPRIRLSDDLFLSLPS